MRCTLASHLFSVIADAHVSPTDTSWTNSNIKGDARLALRQFVAASKAYGVRFAFGLGDLLDRSVNRARALDAWMEALYQLEESGIQFLFIQGNHDRDDPPWLSVHRNAVHLHKRLVNVGPLRVYGLDYQPAGKLQEELAQVPEGTDILLCHQGWSQFMHRPGSFQGSLQEVRNAKLVLTGDLHRYEDVRISLGRKSSRFRVVSPGATCMQAINEPDEHFVLLGDERGNTVKHKLTSRRVLRYGPVTTAEALDATLERLRGDLLTAAVHAQSLPDELRKPLIVLRYSAGLPDVSRRAERAVGDRGFLFCSAASETVDVATGEATAAPASGQITLLDCLAEELSNSATDRSVHQLVTALLTSEDMAAAEAAFRSSYLEEDDGVL